VNILANYDVAKWQERLSRVLRFASRRECAEIERKPRSQDHKGWYVPRALPHFDSPHAMQAITYVLRAMEQRRQGGRPGGRPSNSAHPRSNNVKRSAGLMLYRRRQGLAPSG